MSAEEVLAAAMREHLLVDWVEPFSGTAVGGIAVPPKHTTPTGPKTAASIAALAVKALKAAGYAVIALATEEEFEDYGLYVSRPPNFGLPVGEEHDQGGRFRSVEETRRYAAALLAVAAAAEAVEGGEDE